MANANAKYGEWAFLAGLALSVIVGVASGFVPTAALPMVVAVLAVLGLVVGVMNIHDKEVNSFLVATIALLVVLSSLHPLINVMATVGPWGVTLGSWITTFIGAIAAFIGPAAFVVALKAIHNMAKE